MSKEMVAVMSRCYKTKKLFGIRFDKEKGKVWEFAWAFPLKEGAEKREKGFSVTIAGTFEAGQSYPGCPYCGNIGWFMCMACGKLSCWDGKLMHTVCPHCGNEGDLGRKVTEIKGDGNF